MATMVYHFRLHLLLAFIVALTTPIVWSGEAPAPTFPLWDGRETVVEYAKKVNLPPTQTLDLVGGVKMELMLIPAGKFMMGTPEPESPKVGQMMVGISGGILILVTIILLVRARRKRQWPQFSLAIMLSMMIVASAGVWGGVRWYEALKHPDNPHEHPAHPVTLTQPFYLGKFVVTQEQYQVVTGLTPSHFKGKDNPVEQVSWDDAQAFCKTLGDQTKQTVRLPTEAEWEFACRAGTTTKYYSGDMDKDLDRDAWYESNSNGATHPVGQKEANAFGLHDTHGNVFQWCQDWYADDYYAKSEAMNPQGPSQGTLRLLRGSSWNSDPMYCRSARRLRNNPVNRSLVVGFRVVLVPSFKTP